MVEPGDTVSETLKKEFGEEALNSLELSEKEHEKVNEMLTKLFQNGQTVCALRFPPSLQANLYNTAQFMNYNLIYESYRHKKKFYHPISDILV